MKRLKKFENFNYSYNIGVNIECICNKEKLNLDDNIFDHCKPYNNSVNTINNIYDFLNNKNHKLFIFSLIKSDDDKNKIESWLNNFNINFNEILFINKIQELWYHIDILIDDSDKVINTKPLNKMCIKVDNYDNENSYSEFNVKSINDISINLINKALNNIKK